MGEYATFENFSNRDKSKHSTEVSSRYPKGRCFCSIVSKQSIAHYQALWAGSYSLKSAYFDGYGWFDDLEGEFASKAQAEEAQAKLEAAILEMDTAEQGAAMRG